MSWYSDWFNSEYYLKVYSHRDESEAERLVSLILNNVNHEGGSKVLDMACGSGRHAIAFTKKGFNVTAIDISHRLISDAKQNASKVNVEIDFVLSNILEYSDQRKYHLAVNLFTSIGYFENDTDNFKVIEKAYNFLHSGGYFVLDYFNTEYLTKNLVPATVFSENGLRITQTRSINNNRVRKDITIDKNGSVEKFYESVRLYNYIEVQNFLQSAGFIVNKEFGDYYGKNFNVDTSPRLIIFAHK